MTTTDVLMAAAFTLIVAGAAMVYPFLALIVAGFMLLALVVVIDRRTPPKVEP